MSKATVMNNPNAPHEPHSDITNMLQSSSPVPSLQNLINENDIYIPLTASSTSVSSGGKIKRLIPNDPISTSNPTCKRRTLSLPRHENASPEPEQEHVAPAMTPSLSGNHTLGVAITANVCAMTHCSTSNALQYLPSFTCVTHKGKEKVPNNETTTLSGRVSPVNVTRCLRSGISPWQPSLKDFKELERSLPTTSPSQTEREGARLGENPAKTGFHTLIGFNPCTMVKDLVADAASYEPPTSPIETGVTLDQEAIEAMFNLEFDSWFDRKFPAYKTNQYRRNRGQFDDDRVSFLPWIPTECLKIHAPAFHLEYERRRLLKLAIDAVLKASDNKRKEQGVVRDTNAGQRYTHNTPQLAAFADNASRSQQQCLSPQAADFIPQKSLFTKAQSTFPTLANPLLTEASRRRPNNQKWINQLCIDKAARIAELKDKDDDKKQSTLPQQVSVKTPQLDQQNQVKVYVDDDGKPVTFVKSRAYHEEPCYSTTKCDSEYNQLDYLDAKRSEQEQMATKTPAFTHAPPSTSSPKLSTKPGSSKLSPRAHSFSPSQ